MNVMNFDTILSGIRQSWATCIAPEPAPEWRLLEQGETIIKGDEGRVIAGIIDGREDWGTKHVGFTYGILGNKAWEVRRKVRMQSDGWRFIDVGERIMEGDEFPSMDEWGAITGGFGGKYGAEYVKRFTPRRKES